MQVAVVGIDVGICAGHWTRAVTEVRPNFTSAIVVFCVKLGTVIHRELGDLVSWWFTQASLHE